jgi:type IV pilus assembly protein PilA
MGPLADSDTGRLSHRKSTQEDIMVSSLMKRLNERRAAEFELEGSADAGFTLIELMVVLLILAILLAIAIPTFLGVTGGANDRAAQSNLNTALTTAKAAETQNNQTYTNITANNATLPNISLQANEPSITFSAAAVTTPGPVSMYVDTAGNGIVMSSFSKSSNKCWYAVDNIAPVVGSAANGLYTATSAAGGSATGAPTAAGTYYGKSGATTGVAGSGCDATSLTLVGATWGTTFPS